MVENVLKHGYPGKTEVELKRIYESLKGDENVFIRDCLDTNYLKYNDIKYEWVKKIK